MSRQAQVGIFAILALVLLLVVVYFLTNLGARTGYQLGIHFQSASGLQSNAPVNLSGMQVGSVDKIELLPDDTVDVVVFIKQGIGIPTASRFLIHVPVTGSPDLLIIPPHGGPTPYPTFPPGVAPIAQQPKGENTITLSDLLQAGQGELRKLDTILSALQKSEPKLLAYLQSTLANANDMTARLKSTIDTMAPTLQTDLATAGGNFAAMSETLRSAATLDAPKLNSMLSQLDDASLALKNTMTSVESLATNPRLHQSLIATMENVEQSTLELRYLLEDTRTITSDPATQEHIRNSLANLDALMQRAASLLGKLGGRSHVYGVDRGVPPPPASPGPAPASSPHPLSQSERLNLGSALSGLAAQLIAIDLRIGELDRQPELCCTIYPQVPYDRGPQTDLNVTLLPHSKTSLWFGANDIGNGTTWNVDALERIAPGVQLGGGIVYSQLGVLGRFGAHGTGLDARLYDPQHPMVDLYGTVRVAPWAQIFFGERALNQPWRRTDFGLQFHYN
jgi:hypothetical protein